MTDDGRRRPRGPWGWSTGRFTPSAASTIEGVFVIEIAARPIGGLCARALRFDPSRQRPMQSTSLEALLLRHALGEQPTGWVREAAASGVMMIPMPRRGVFRRLTGVDEARAVPRRDRCAI